METPTDKQTERNLAIVAGTNIPEEDIPVEYQEKLKIYRECVQSFEPLKCAIEGDLDFLSKWIFRHGGFSLEKLPEYIRLMKKKRGDSDTIEWFQTYYSLKSYPNYDLYFPSISILMKPIFDDLAPFPRAIGAVERYHVCLVEEDKPLKIISQQFPYNGMYFTMTIIPDIENVSKIKASSRASRQYIKENHGILEFVLIPPLSLLKYLDSISSFENYIFLPLTGIVNYTLDQKIGHAMVFVFDIKKRWVYFIDPNIDYLKLFIPNRNSQVIIERYFAEYFSFISYRYIPLYENLYDYEIYSLNVHIHPGECLSICNLIVWLVKSSGFDPLTILRLFSYLHDVEQEYLIETFLRWNTLVLEEKITVKYEKKDYLKPLFNDPIFQNMPIKDRERIENIFYQPPIFEEPKEGIVSRLLKG